MKSRHLIILACCLVMSSCSGSGGAQPKGLSSARTRPSVHRSPSFSPLPSPITIASDGPEVPLIYRIPQAKNQVFITIDDGFWPDDRVTALIEKEHVPISMFLIAKIASMHLSYYKRLQKDGAIVENHTINHYLLPHYPLSWQIHQICDAIPLYEKMFGTRPILMRPPGGAFNPQILRIAHACGITAAIMWSAEMKFGHLDLSHGHSIQGGDIILFHFRSDLYHDLQYILSQIRQLHLTIGRLEDYIKASI